MLRRTLMSHILGLKFRDSGSVYYYDDAGHDVRPGDRVLVETEHGLALARVALVQDEPPTAKRPDAAEPGGPAAVLQEEDETSGATGTPDEPAPPEPADTADTAASDSEDGAQDEDAHEAAPDADVLESIVRVADEADLAVAAENDALAKEAFAECRRLINERNLDMKLVDVEVYFDRGKIVFYFTAPTRIDFRDLVKELVKTYRTRIELRQIGVRHETQMTGAVGNCGQLCCCRRFLRKFEPVTIKMAKEQNLFLNPTKISGICGRLLCCLAYEQKGYEAFHAKCPRVGKRYLTKNGLVKVLRANFFRESISLLPEEGDEMEVTVEEWNALEPRRPDPNLLNQTPRQPKEPRKGQDKRAKSKPRNKRDEDAPRPRPEKSAQNKSPAKAGAEPHETTPDASADISSEMASGDGAHAPREEQATQGGVFGLSAKPGDAASSGGEVARGDDAETEDSPPRDKHATPPREGDGAEKKRPANRSRRRSSRKGRSRGGGKPPRPENGASGGGEPRAKADQGGKPAGKEGKPPRRRRRKPRPPKPKE